MPADYSGRVIITARRGRVENGAGPAGANVQRVDAAGEFGGAGAEAKF
jgi:hypothetical protein